MEFKKLAFATAVFVVVSAALFSLTKKDSPRSPDSPEESTTTTTSSLAKMIIKPFGASKHEGYTIEDFLNGL